MADADSQISRASCFLDHTSSVTIQIARIAQPSRQSANMNKKLCQACPNHLVYAICDGNATVRESAWMKQRKLWKAWTDSSRSRSTCGRPSRSFLLLQSFAINSVKNLRPIILHDITSKPRSFDNCVCSSQQNWQRLSSQLAEPNLQCTSTIALVIAFPGVLTINISRPSQAILLRCPKNKSQLIIVGNRGQVS